MHLCNLWGCRPAKPHLFVEFAAGEFTTHDFPGAASTALRGINNRGDLSGTYLTSLSADPIGYIQQRRTGRAITFKDPEPGSTGIVVGKINDRGDVVGYYTTAAQALAGFVRYANGQFLQISVAGADATQAYGINDCGIVVGAYVIGSSHGFYGRPGALQTLDLPGVAGTRVLGVNNAGRVVGVYFDTTGIEHGFVTDAVPAASCRSTGE